MKASAQGRNPHQQDRKHAEVEPLKREHAGADIAAERVALFGAAIDQRQRHQGPARACSALQSESARSNSEPTKSASRRESSS